MPMPVSLPWNALMCGAPCLIEYSSLSLQSMISILAEAIRAPRDEISTTQLASLELEPTKPESEEVESAQSAIADQHGEASDEFELEPNASDPLSPRSLSTNEPPSTTEAEQLAASADQVEPARVLPSLNPRNESAEKETKSIDLKLNSSS